MGDPGFLRTLARGRSLRLRTADRALAFMGRPPLEPLLKAEVEAFLAVSGTKASVLGEEALGDRAFVGRLRRGASPYLETFDRARAWMAANASEEELRAVRGRLAGVADPLGATRDAAQAPAAGVDAEEDSPANGNHLDTREAAARLGLSPGTLERCRASGEGPEFQKPGSRVRYRLEDIEAWASARRWTSLSEERGARRRKR